MTKSPSNLKDDPIRILVVDDDPIQRSLIAARLVRLNSSTAEAGDGATAWNLLRSETFDLAIVDLCMPGLDGIGLIQCMRGHPRTRHIPIIVITSRNDSAAIDASLQAGASSFLVKPVAWSMFEHHVGFLMQLVRQAKDARIGADRAIAASSAKDAIIRNLFGETASRAKTILSQVQHLKHLPLAADQTQLAMRNINEIEDNCQIVMQSARKALNTLHLLEDRVLVDDRSEGLAQMMTGLAEMARPEVENAGLRLAVALPAHETHLSCSAEAIELALVSLLDNAIQHAPKGSTITIDCVLQPDNALTIEVRDQGEGMSQGLLLQCLAPLRAPLEEDTNGSHRVGSGLLLAKAIVESHGGKLEVHTAPGRGTSALLFLPSVRVTKRAAAA